MSALSTAEYDLIFAGGTFESYVLIISHLLIVLYRWSGSVLDSRSIIYCRPFSEDPRPRGRSAH